MKSNLTMVRYIKGNGKKDFDTEKVSKNGKMELNILDNGTMTKSTELDNFGM